MYELMVAGRADSAAKLFELVEKLLKDAEASSVSSSKMGKKNLAYPIKKQTEAEYFVFNFEAPSQSILKISDGLRLEQAMVLRYMIITQKRVKGTNGAKGTDGSKVSSSAAKAIEDKKVSMESAVEEKPKEEAKVKASVKVAPKVKTKVKSEVKKVKKGTK